MNKRFQSYITAFFAALLLSVSPTFATNEDNTKKESKEELNPKELIIEHLADAYEWQIVSDGTKHLTIPLPVILHSKTTGWHLFSSSHFHHGANAYKGFVIASEGKYKGKIVEAGADETISSTCLLQKMQFHFFFHPFCSY